MKAVKASHRAHIFYSGRVQGVGFRYETEALAHRIGVVGWVKNLQDGRVEVVCEGSKQKMDQFLAELQGGSLGRHIQKTDCRWENPTHEFDDFRVEFCY